MTISIVNPCAFGFCPGDLAYSQAAHDCPHGNPCRPLFAAGKVSFKVPECEQCRALLPKPVEKPKTKGKRGGARPGRKEQRAKLYDADDIEVVRRRALEGALARARAAATGNGSAPGTDSGA